MHGCCAKDGSVRYRTGTVRTVLVRTHQGKSTQISHRRPRVSQRSSKTRQGKFHKLEPHFCKKVHSSAASSNIVYRPIPCQTTIKMFRFLLVTLISSFAVLSGKTNAFVPPLASNVVVQSKPPFLLGGKKPIESALFAKKKVKEDLSYIESRDMTREEMVELNKKNEDIMNMELQMMTGFSLIIILPILYLCWVAFFSE